MINPFTKYKRRIADLEAEIKAMEDTNNKSWQEISASMNENGRFNCTLTGPVSDMHPAVKVLAAACLSLIDVDAGNIRNYQSFTLECKPAKDFPGFYLNGYVIKHGGKTPHELRLEAEHELAIALDRIKALEPAP